MGQRYDDVAQLVPNPKTTASDCNIDVLAPDWCKPLLARMPEVRQAITMPIRHGAFALGERYRIGKSLRNQYDMAIILPNSLKSAFIPYFANIRFDGVGKGKSVYFAQ